LVENDLFNSKLRIATSILDTDFDSYMIDYSCFDGMKFSRESALEPVHIVMVAISTRDPDTSDEDLNKFTKLALNKLTELKMDNFTTFVSGEKG